MHIAIFICTDSFRFITIMPLSLAMSFSLPRQTMDFHPLETYATMRPIKNMPPYPLKYSDMSPPPAISSFYTYYTKVPLSRNSACSYEHIFCTAQSNQSYHSCSKNMPSTFSPYPSYPLPNFPGLWNSRSLYIRCFTIHTL